MAVSNDYNESVYSYYNHNDEISLAEDQDEIHSAFHLLCAACYVLIFCISMPGNSFLLWVLLRERCWKTTSDILLLQLTVSALCVTVTLPFGACNLLKGWIFGNWACIVTQVAYFLGLNICVVTLTAMTLHHYIAVVHASCLSAQASKRFLHVASIVICAAASIRVSMNFKAQDSGSGDILCVHYPHSLTALLTDIYLQSGLFFLIPFVVITFCYVHMWITTKQCGINRHHQASGLILGMTVGLFLCLAPYYISLFVESLKLLGVLNYAFIPHYVVYVVVTLPHFHCCLNLCHIFGVSRFRRHLCVTLCLCDVSLQRGDGSQDLNLMAVILQHDTSM